VGIDDNATSTAITIDASENVALVGDALLGSLTGFSGGTGALTIADSASNPTISIRGPDAGTANIYFGDTTDWTQGAISYDFSTDAMRFYTSNINERMRIDSAGNVLVGTTDSSVYNNGTNTSADTGINLSTYAGFARYNATPMYVNRTGTDGAIIVFNKSGAAVGSIGAKLGGLYIADGGVGLRFDSGGTDDIIPSNSTGATADASINLGASGGRFKDLHLSGQAWSADVRSAGIQYFTHTTDVRFRTSTGAERMRIDSAGSVLVGKTVGDGTAGSTVGIELDANGGLEATRSGNNAGMFSRRGSNGNCVLFRRDATSVGAITVTTTGTTYNTTSDLRLKTDIKPISNSTEKLMAMNPVTHGWKANPEADTVHGFIAQEMIEIIPEAVSGEPEGEEMMSMDYGRITPVIVAALQEANKKIAEIETRLNELETK
jgi:hypothetical protein